jgi:phosphoglycerol geranylgeranyltransferase
MHVFQKITENTQAGKKMLAVLVDPDKVSNIQAESIARSAHESGVDFLFVGGSLLTNGNLANCIRRLKYASPIPVVLFPGSSNQVDEQADAILFLSLISGRNADLLIGKQVASAPLIREKKLEAIGTGYMLIESGNMTTALYMSNTLPVPADKPDIAACTALAGEMLGLKLIFMDAGSGAKNVVPAAMIRHVRDQISVPLIVGGGIRTPQQAAQACNAGADMIVVGNIIEKEPELLGQIANAVKGSKVFSG